MSDGVHKSSKRETQVAAAIILTALNALIFGRAVSTYV